MSRLWELLARKYNNDLSTEEEEELNRLLGEQKDALDVNEILTNPGGLEVKKLTSIMDEARSREWIARRMAERRVTMVETADVFADPVRPWYKRQGFLWAAITAGVLLGGAWLYQAARPGAAPEDKPSQVATSQSKTRILLPDGTQVVLNKNSKLSYNKDFGHTKREIALVGEAYFDVAKNESVPLFVQAGPVRIAVLGTAFDVRAYTGDSIVETSLIKGSIEVSSANDPGRTILMRPYEKIVFSRSRTAAAPPTETSATEKDKPEPSLVKLDRIRPNAADSSINEIVWTQDRLVFQREPFQSVAWKMERWYGVKINFGDAASEKLLITGSLEKENLREALDALRQITPFDYDVIGSVVTIHKRENY